MGRKFAAVVFSLGCLQASSALALGLGELKLESFLNQPLDASVDLLNVGNLHEDEIKVRLATREDFKRLGMDRSFFLTSIRFEVVVEDGRARIVMTSDDPVLEPYLDFIVEARWPTGRLLREYTVLIDPPAFSQATPVVSASQRVEEVEGIPAPGKKKALVSSSGTQVDVRKSNLGPGEMPQRNFNAGAGAAPAPGDRYMIKRDDTLWQIASSARPAGATVHQTMLDIQRLNPDAFVNNNINRVKAGYIIYLPSAADISSADVESALAQVREQNAAWREGRDAELAVAAGPSLRISAQDEEPAAAALETRGTIGSGSGADIDAAGAASQGDVSGSGGALDDRVATLERIVDLKDEQIAALQAALAKAQAAAGGATAESVEDTAAPDDLYGDTEDGEARAVADSTWGDDAFDSDSEQATEDEYIDEQGIEEQPSLAAADDLDGPGAAVVDSADSAAEDDNAGASSTKAASTTSPDTTTASTASSAATTASTGKASTQDAQTESSGGIMDYLWYILAAVGLAIVGFIVARLRNRDDEEDSDYDEEAFANVELKEQSFDVSGDDAQESVATASAPPESAETAAAAPSSTRGYGERKHDAYASDVEAADALAEADIYIAYGRHRQAIELLNTALQSEPNNPIFRLKLMEIHTELNDRTAASEQLHQLRSIGDEDYVTQAEALLASLDSEPESTGGSAEAAATGPAAGDPGEPGLAPNPFMTDDSEELAADFTGLEIEDNLSDAPDDELDLSEDFTDEDDEELVIAADANGMSTKLDLARAYIDMGDDDGARQILEEVVAEGSDAIKAEAQELLDRIG